MSDHFYENAQKEYDVAMNAMLPLLNSEAKKYNLHVIYISPSSVYRVLDENSNMVYIGSALSVLSFLNNFGSEYANEG